VGAALAHLLSKRPIAMQGVGSNDAAFERKHLQHFQRTLRLVAARRLARGQRHAGFGGEDIDHVQRRGTAASLVCPSNRLAIDCHHAGKLDPVGLGECGHKASEGPLESLRIERVEDAAERVVIGDSMWQSKELPQQLFFGGCKHLYIRRPLSSSHSMVANAMTITSNKSCSALGARGSGKALNILRIFCIGPSWRIESPLQNTYRWPVQHRLQIHIRFPCGRAGGLPLMLANDSPRRAKPRPSMFTAEQWMAFSRYVYIASKSIIAEMRYFRLGNRASSSTTARPLTNQPRGRRAAGGGHLLRIFVPKPDRRQSGLTLRSATAPRSRTRTCVAIRYKSF
jgi:hypothetical protein